MPNCEHCCEYWKIISASLERSRKKKKGLLYLPRSNQTFTWVISQMVSLELRSCPLIPCVQDMKILLKELFLSLSWQIVLSCAFPYNGDLPFLHQCVNFFFFFNQRFLIDYSCNYLLMTRTHQQEQNPSLYQHL